MCTISRKQSPKHVKVVRSWKITNFIASTMNHYMHDIRHQRKNVHLHLRCASSFWMLIITRSSWFPFVMELLWMMTTGGQMIKSSFKAKPSVLDKIFRTHRLWGPASLLHPNSTHSALWKPKCSALDPGKRELNACCSKLSVSINSFECLINGRKIK